MSEVVKTISPEVEKAILETSRKALAFYWNQVMHYKARPSSFVDFVIGLDESNEGMGAAFIQAIELVRSSEISRLARRIAALGLERYPDNETLQKLAEDMRPTEWEIARRNRKDVNFNPDLRWITDNTDEYWGQWVAVRDGQLRGTAAKRKELIQILGGEPGAETLIARVVI